MRRLFCCSGNVFILVIAYAIQYVFKVENNSEHSATHHQFIDCGEFRKVAYGMGNSTHQCQRHSVSAHRMCP
jgi:hypothetical protein